MNISHKLNDQGKHDKKKRKKKKKKNRTNLVTKSTTASQVKKEAIQNKIGMKL